MPAMPSGWIARGEVRQRFTALVEELRRNPKIRVAEAKLGDPADASLIERARAANGGELPADVEAFYRQMNGFTLSWREASDEGRRDGLGASEIIPIEGVFRERPAWKLGENPVDTLVVPFDRFTEEASYAFCRYPVRQTRVWTSAPGEPETCEPTAHEFEAFLDLYLHARAIRYFGDTLTEAGCKSSSAEEFKRLAPKLFADFDANRFQPLPVAPVVERLAADLGLTGGKGLDLEYAKFPEGLFTLLEKAHWDREGIG
jgi:hypothetical protein